MERGLRRISAQSNQVKAGRPWSAKHTQVEQKRETERLQKNVQRIHVNYYAKEIYK